VCIDLYYLHRSVLQCVAVCGSVWQCVAVCGSVLQSAAVCCNVLQCVAMCCSVYEFILSTPGTIRSHRRCDRKTNRNTGCGTQYTATHCTATHCNTRNRQTNINTGWHRFIGSTSGRSFPGKAHNISVLLAHN